jgi:hypothetical protein
VKIGYEEALKRIVYLDGRRVNHNLVKFGLDAHFLCLCHALTDRNPH